jgi:diadenosine tetraphosphate (Ap4A) HIT family hydrolase
MGLIADRVDQARAGANPSVLARLPSGWVVIGDIQLLPGYCLLLADPVVPSLNDLTPEARGQFLQDMARVGDAILKATDSFRINYEILGNSEPELHAHILPRYLHEPDERRRMPVWFYDWPNGAKYSSESHGKLFQAIRRLLETEA